MPTFSKHVLSQYLRTQCQRQLKLNLYSNSERVRLGMPEEDKVRATIQLLTEEGKRWQATVLGHLDATFGSTHIIGQRKPGQPHRFDPSPLGTLMQHAQPGCFLVEAKYEVDAPAQTFRSALGLTTIHDYQGSPLHFEAV